MKAITIPPDCGEEITVDYWAYKMPVDERPQCYFLVGEKFYSFEEMGWIKAINLRIFRKLQQTNKNMLTADCVRSTLSRESDQLVMITTAIKKVVDNKIDIAGIMINLDCPIKNGVLETLRKQGYLVRGIGGYTYTVAWW